MNEIDMPMNYYVWSMGNNAGPLSCHAKADQHCPAERLFVDDME